MQKTDYAGVIRKTFQDEGLAGAVSRIPLERKFKLDSVKEVIYSPPSLLIENGSLFLLLTKFPSHL